MNSVKRDRIWSLMYAPGNPEADSLIASISRETGLSPIMVSLLRNRGCHTVADVKSFLKTDSKELLHDPFLMKDIQKAVERIEQAIAAKEKIAIYGDYDVDGVTSVTALYLYLKSRGADVIYYIPSRSKEGYGLSEFAIDTLIVDRVSLIITVDTGITANNEADYARSKGIDMIITDHHECHDELPTACAVVNIHRPDCPYPFKELAGVGVVFKLLCACEKKRCLDAGISPDEGINKICNEYSDLTAIGTIADVMPITDENRFIVATGLERIQTTKRLGLRALIDAVNGGDKNKRKINSGFIGFGIAPRINAAGRISSASQAVDLLLAETERDAAVMAEELCAINTQRQIEENRIAEQAYKIIEQEIDLENTYVIVLEDDGWQQGIIGIVASRITEKYGLPSILISFDGQTRGYPSADDVGKGSGRSVKGMNLVSAMSECRDLLVRYGGHELAAGLSISRENIPEFRRRINEYAKSMLSAEGLTVRVDADCELQMRDMTMQLAVEINRLEPFGVANAQPSFIARDVTIQRIISLAGGKHTKLILARDGMSVQAIWFGMQASKLQFLQFDCVDVMFQLSINDFQNVKSIQLIVQDMRICERYSNECKREIDRYNQIRSGAEFYEDEDVIPTRDDMAMVYKLLRSEFRIGHGTFSERTLLSLINGVSETHINYIKMKFILLVFRELQICGVEEYADGVYMFDIYNTIGKTNVDKSSIIKKLNGQRRTRI